MLDRQGISTKDSYFTTILKKNNIWTKRGIPWVLKKAIPFNSRTEALKAEKFIKSQKSRRVILDIIQNGYHK
jgi:putative endonuclease